MLGVIFGGAPVNPLLQPAVPQADCVICADGGLRLAQALQVEPDLIMGDFDSLGEIPQELKVKVYPAQKDDTDMMLAVQEAVNRGCDELVIYGGLGGRLDHFYANVQMLLQLAQKGIFAGLVDEKHRVSVQLKGKQVYQKDDFPYISLFALSEECVVTTEGLAYPLTHGVLKNNIPLGVSNEINECQGSIEVEQGELLVIQARD